MIGTALILLLAAQEAPAAEATTAAVEGGDIVVRATFGFTTMLFDRGADGKLRNCRIMVSSGSQRRDTAACQATPICYAGTADEVDKAAVNVQALINYAAENAAASVVILDTHFPPYRPPGLAGSCRRSPPEGGNYCPRSGLRGSAVRNRTQAASAPEFRPRRRP